jgi:IS30 family transposase
MVIRKNVENRHSKEIFLNVKKDYVVFEEEFGHLEGDTIVGIHHKSAIITLVERLSKAIIALKPEGRKAVDIENSINEWLQSVPKKSFQINYL